MCAVFPYYTGFIPTYLRYVGSQAKKVRKGNLFMTTNLFLEETYIDMNIVPTSVY